MISFHDVEVQVILTYSPEQSGPSWLDEKLDAFLSFNERDLLTHAGKVQASVVQALAEERFAEFDSARMHRAVLEEDRADLDSLRAIERKLEGGK